MSPFSVTGNLYLILFIKKYCHPAPGKGTDTSEKQRLGSCHDMQDKLGVWDGRQKPWATRDVTHTERWQRHVPEDGISQNHSQWIISALMCYHHSGSYETGQFNWISVNEGRFLHFHPGLILYSVKWECCQGISNLKVPVQIKAKNTAQNNILNFKFSTPNMNLISLSVVL